MFAKVVENGGTDLSISKAMRDVGYSEETAHTPQKLTESKGWLELLDKYLPDDLLLEKHQALLTKEDATGAVDTQAVKAGLDMGYKLKGAYAPERSVALNLNKDMNENQQADAVKEEYEKKLADSYRNSHEPV